MSAADKRSAGDRVFGVLVTSNVAIASVGTTQLSSAQVTEIEH